MGGGGVAGWDTVRDVFGVVPGAGIGAAVGASGGALVVGGGAALTCAGSVRAAGIAGALCIVSDAVVDAARERCTTEAVALGEGLALVTALPSSDDGQTGTAICRCGACCTYAE